MRSQQIPQVDFLLIGGGLASATAAGTLRNAGAEGRIAILSAETTLPYHRPPLSKDFLVKGHFSAHRTHHRKENIVRKADHRTHLAVLVHILAAFKTEGGRNSQIFPHLSGCPQHVVMLNQRLPDFGSQIVEQLPQPDGGGQ